MRGRIDTILTYVKFGDDPVSSLDFSFIGGCTLNWVILSQMSKDFKKHPVLFYLNYVL